MLSDDGYDPREIPCSTTARNGRLSRRWPWTAPAALVCLASALSASGAAAAPVDTEAHAGPQKVAARSESGNGAAVAARPSGANLPGDRSGWDADPNFNEETGRGDESTAAETAGGDDSSERQQQENLTGTPDRSATPRAGLDAANQGTAQPAAAKPGYFGPSQPIGHRLDTPEAKQRIATLLAEKVRGSVSNTPVEVDENLPPLVGGKYGFAQPQSLEDGVPSALIQLGAVGPRYAIIVEKLHHRLSIFQSDQGSPMKLVKTFRAITGKDPADKAAKGDLRTPEGVYFVKGRIPDHALPPKYGRLALTLDYPNPFDRIQSKSGYGIWLHATDDPSRLLKPFDTEGCIAVSNEDVLEIERYITPEVTPLIITKEMSLDSEAAAEQARSEALRMLESWRQSWQSSNLATYIDYYSKDFREKHMNKEGWKAFKTHLAKLRSDIEVKISDPTVVAVDGQLVMSFLQEYVSNGHSDFGIKSLYLRWESDRYRIVSEQWRPLQKTETALQELQRAEGQL